MGDSAYSQRLSGLRVLVLVLMIVSFALPLGSVSSARAQDNFQNVTSYRVEGVANFTNPGGEPFWSSIPWTSIPLAASVQPGGGHTSAVLVKSANDGFNIFVLFRWNDSQGPSYSAQTEAYTAPNGTLLPLTPQTTIGVTQLFYNSTYYYPDRAAILWFIGANSTIRSSPKMELGSDGAITGGAANIWHWQSNPTDNNANDSGFPGGYTTPVGTTIFPPDNLSFAEDDYTNTTGFYVVGGSFGEGSPNLDPYTTPFDILAASQYSFANGTWTVEMTRSFTTDAPSYRVQLATNSSYYVAFAVWQGKLGESSDFKSVSQWYSLTVSDQAPNVPPPTSVPQGVTPLLAAAVAIGTALVGLVVGTALRRGGRESG